MQKHITETELVTAEQIARVDSIVDSLQSLDATADGAEALASAQAGYTWPDIWKY